MSDPLVIAALGGGAVLALFAGAAETLDGPGRARRRRLRDFVAEPRGPDAAPRRALASLPASLALAIGRPLVALWPRTLAADAARGAALAAGSAVIGLVAGSSAAVLAAGTGALLLGAVGGAILGYAVPRIGASRARAGERRHLLSGLPNALDLLALAADAGLGFDAALAQVLARLDGPLAAELRRVLVEVRIGRDRRLALREFARRTALAETARFANAIVQADGLGLPLARTFRELANELRLRRRQVAEEQARTAPIKMLFPMVLLIFPALFIVILGPAVPQLMEGLNVGP